MTLRKRWDRRRNIALALAALSGASCRFLADVFDLNPSRVSRILKGMRAEFEGRGGMTAAGLLLAIEEIGSAGKDRLPDPKSVGSKGDREPCSREKAAQWRSRGC
jgi:hypothetical protein